MMTLPRRRLLLASIHDVTPRFEGEVDRLLEVILPHVGWRVAMLVVPNHWGDSPIVPGSPFASKIRTWADHGIEIFLHGYFHRDDTRHLRAAPRLRARWMTAGEGEFLGLDSAEAADRILAGRGLIEQVTGRPIAGFVAPAWLYGHGAIEALKECEIGLAEDHWRVWSPASGATLSRGPVITWASRSSWRLRSSLLAAAALRHSPARVLRIGVHPPDCLQPALLSSIEATFRSATTSRQVGRYADLRISG